MSEKKFARKCDCITWKNVEDFGMGDAAFNLVENSETLSERTPWLELVRCNSCLTYWYLGIDEHNDDYHIMRLSEAEVEGILKKNKWPTIFDDRRIFWPDHLWLSVNGYKSIQEWLEKEGLRKND